MKKFHKKKYIKNYKKLLLPFLPNIKFLYCKETSQNLKAFRSFQGGIEMKHWEEMGLCLPRYINFATWTDQSIQVIHLCFDHLSSTKRLLSANFLAARVSLNTEDYRK